MLQVWLAKASSKILLALVAVILVLSIGWYEHHAGYEAAKALWSAKYDKLVSDTKAASAGETSRQTSANLAAQQQMAHTVTMLNGTIYSREGTLKENESEAARDPNAGRVSISVDGVRRINRAGGR